MLILKFDQVENKGKDFLSKSMDIGDRMLNWSYKQFMKLVWKCRLGIDFYILCREVWILF